MTVTTLPSAAFDLFKHRHVVQIVSEHAGVGVEISKRVLRSLRRSFGSLGPHHHLTRQGLHARVDLFSAVRFWKVRYGA